MRNSFKQLLYLRVIFDSGQSEKCISLSIAPNRRAFLYYLETS